MMWLAIGGCWLVGLLLLGLVAGRAGPFWRRLPAQLPEALAAGAVLGHLFFLLVGWLGPVPLWSYLAPAGVLAAGCCWHWRRPAEGFAGAPAPGASVWGVALTLVAAQLLVLLPGFALPLFDWDTRILWGVKAKLLAADGTLVTDAFRDPYRLHIHPRYPLLVPWLAALGSGPEGAAIEAGLRLVVVLFGGLALCQLGLEVGRRRGVLPAAALGGVLLATAPWLEGLFWVQVEVVLAAFLLFALLRVGRWLESGRAADLLLASLFLAGAALTKNEGLLLALLLPAGLACSGLSGASWRERLAAAGRLALCTWLLLIPWLLQRAAIPAVSDENYLSQLLSTAGWDRAASRLVEVPALLAGILFDVNTWHLFWMMALPLAAWSLWPGRHATCLQRLTALVMYGYLAGITVIYLMSPWREVAQQVAVSAQRVLLPLLPAGLLLFGERYGEGKRGE